MKIHILPKLIEGPFGGANQFAKALRLKFIERGIYTDDIKQANLLIMNGYPFRDPHAFQKAFEWKERGNGKRFIISRVDGPVAEYRHNTHSEIYDSALYEFSDIASDGIIVQSQWSLSRMNSHQKAPHCLTTVIGNAPNPNIFYPSGKEKTDSSKTKLVASSWSSNPHKGFNVYAWLDKNLDFSRFDFTIVGNTDQTFENAKVVPALPQEKLADLLRENDIYITASRIEACSNATLEALQCGLPVIAPNSSSHPEFMPSSDLLFDKKEEILSIIDKISNNIEKYKKEIHLKSIDEITQRYIGFSEEVLNNKPKMFSKNSSRNFLISYQLHQTLRQKFMLLLKQFVKNLIERLKKNESS